MAKLFFNHEEVLLEDNGAIIDGYGFFINRLDLPGAIMIEQLSSFIYARDGVIDVSGTLFWTDDYEEDFRFERLLNSLEIEYTREVSGFRHSHCLKYEYVVKA